MADISILSAMFIYLAAAVVMVPLTRQLGMGSVLGYLIAGVIIGPFGLQLSGDVHTIQHFSEFGVVLMMFLIGLELNPKKLWRLRGPILGMGGMQVLLTSILLGVILILMKIDFSQSVVLGMMLSLSSTAIVLQSLTEKGLLKRSSGQNCFSVLLFQDIIVIPMLIIIPLFSMTQTLAAGGADDGWMEHLTSLEHALVVLGAVAAVIFAGHYLVSPFLRMITRSQMREIFIAASLLLVVAIASLMEMVGLSAALGAFLAGVVLAESEYRHELEVTIDPLKGLLLGIFFVSVGAAIDFNLFFENPTLILILVCALMAVKMVILILIGRVFRMPTQDLGLFALALAQSGEFAFVIGNYALQLKVLTVTNYDMMVLVVALSMLVTPALLIIHDQILAPKLSGNAKEEHKPDEILPEGKIIIAGFGRFGQMVGRLLIANNISLTILENDPKQIDVLRRWGHKVFYGDVTRADLLEAAGAKEAKLLIVAVEDMDNVSSVVEQARQKFPNLKIMVRAHDRQHAYELKEKGVHYVIRETFGSAIDMGIACLRELGWGAYRAERAGQIFKNHDEESFNLLADLWGDEKSYGTAMISRRDDLKQILLADRNDISLYQDSSWQTGDDLESSEVKTKEEQQIQKTVDGILSRITAKALGES